MAEAFGYRETLELLAEKHPMLVTRQTTTVILGCCTNTLDKIIKKGHIKVVDGKIPLGSIARYICGYC